MERTAAKVQERVDAMVERCREMGMNVTPQRMAIYRALLESEEHPSPEMLYRKVQESMPSLSLATIYKSLEALERLGLVRQVPLISETKRYDANLDHHHHLVCTSCGCVTDFYSDEIKATLPRRKFRGFTPEAVSVNITGTCQECRGRERSTD